MNREFTDFLHLTNYLDEEYGGRIAFKFFRGESVESITYHQFAMDINGAAFYFHDRAKGNARYPVALIGKSSYEWMVYYLGILNSNNIVVPCNPLLSKEELTNILNLVEVKYVLLDDMWYDYKEYILEHCKTVEQVLLLQEDFQEITKTKEFIAVEINQEEICQYAFTSGTTAGSKVVTYSYRNILSSIGPERITPFKPYDTFFSILPMYHCLELFAGQLMSLTYGCTICIDGSMENMKYFQPTMMCVVPITGRKKNVIILKTGENVFPEEIETYLNGIPEVNSSLVLEWKEQIVAVIYPEYQEKQEVIKEKIKELNRGVPGYKRITRVFFRKNPFPTTSIGKIKRQQVIEELEVEDKVEYTAATTETQKKIVEVVGELLDIEKKISIQDNFFALGGSSLTALKLGAKLKIQAQWVYEYPMIMELAKFIDGSIGQKQEEPEEVNSWITKNQNRVRKTPVTEVVLTGASGFLGSHILFELLKHKDIHVTCLIRNEAKFRKIYKLYFSEEVPSRVSILLGDITKENMGIEESVYYKLLEKADTVIHAAANVHHVGNLEEFMNTNYKGTETMIKFCQDADASLQFISSYAVSGIAVVPIDCKQHIFNEDTLYIGQDYTQNVYVHTKYLSEKKILMERENGLRANIYRIGCLTSRKSDGVFQLNEGENGLRNRLRGLWKTGIYTREMALYPVDFTYVDECAQAVAKLTLCSKENNIYQLYNPNMLRFSDLEEIHNRNGFLDKWRLVSQEEFNKQMESMLSDKEIAEYAFYHSMALASTPIPMDCKKTLNQLRKLSFQWSNVEDGYVMDFIGEKA